ncbi:STAS domain-containing protein [Peribacillus psychrosaccharolyticus]|uniref:STAS domain-containing protein n=1 Tax=Peribacillus psychrosaccharolyticus TaxID=1407 RepID=A0A974NKD4_PERPY|nr:STAS domain-containing protein [Peribacillus psychrosaccharolyticus]MEC2055717.1 STAS domain-containing protein [Peribacillus psychrosaccharolyticus]MED3743256.1 STAS domain-containing protein [Peribacillus psychrosaccharolyticus]QQS99372.1 STAS domain-containing protein [Peribacillus psychrosaccharolyticus]
MEELKRLGEKLIKNKYIFAEHIDLLQNDHFSFGGIMVREWRADLVQIQGEALIYGKEQAEKKMSTASLNLGKVMVESGAAINLAIENTMNSRHLFWSFIEEEVSNQKYSINILLNAMSTIDALLDISLRSISLGFVNHYKETTDITAKSLQHIKNQQSVIKTLSTPIIQTVMDGVIHVPLSGELNEDRMKDLQKKVVNECKVLVVDRVIIDFTGISEQDSNLFPSLEELVHSLSSIGTKTIFVGFSPFVIREINGKGLFNKVIIYSSFRQAINELLRNKGLKIGPIS